MATGEHPSVMDSGDKWRDINSLLDSRHPVGLLSLDEGKILNGDIHQADPKDLYLGEVESMKGEYVLLPSNLIEMADDDLWSEPTKLAEDQRNDWGFYIGRSTGSPLEVKYDENIPSDEGWHSHSGFEAYVPTSGDIELGMRGSEDDLNQEFQSVEIEENQLYLVEPYVQHKVINQSKNPDLAVIRYPEESQEMVSKYDGQGNKIY